VAGTDLGVLWSDTRDGNREIYFRLVDRDGTPKTAELRVTTTPATSFNPVLGGSGAAFGAAWGESLGGNSFQTQFQSLSLSGTPVGLVKNHVVVSSAFVPGRSLRWTGASYASAWQSNTAGTDDIYFNRYTADGDPFGADITVSNDPGAQAFPSVTPTPSGYGIAWADDRDGQLEIYFAALDGQGQKFGADVRLTNAAGASFAPTIEWNGSEFGVNWWDNRSGTSEEYFARFDAGGAPIGPEIQLNPGMYGQAGQMKWTGSEFGFVWADYRNNLMEPYFTRLDADGVKLGDDVRISTSNLEMDLEALDMVWAGDRYAIAFADNRTGDVEIYLAIVTCN